MNHYTLNTGHTRLSPRAEVDDGTIEQLQPMLRTGRHALTIADYFLQVAPGGDVFLATLYHVARPCVTIGVCRDDAGADRLWPQIEQTYLQVTELPGQRNQDWKSPVRPESTPWCAAALLFPPQDCLDWVGDFERCLAWAWLEAANAD